MSGGRILVFARAPVPGTCKTRLIPALGAEGAAAVQARLTERVLEEAARVSGARIELHCAGDPAHPFLAGCAARFGAALHRQEGADLGARMDRALRAALARGGPVVLVGSDSPDLSAGDMASALHRLGSGTPVALGPAADGGYLLVGLAAPLAGLFDGIPWGGPDVLARTRRRLRSLGLCWWETPVRHDVDRPDDLALLDGASER